MCKLKKYKLDAKFKLNWKIEGNFLYYLLCFSKIYKLKSGYHFGNIKINVELYKNKFW